MTAVPPEPSPVDLSPEIHAICEKLGHPHDQVGHLYIYPNRVVALVYDVNAGGNIFAGADGDVSSQTITTSISS